MKKKQGGKKRFNALPARPKTYRAIQMLSEELDMPMADVLKELVDSIPKSHLRKFIIKRLERKRKKGEQITKKSTGRIDRILRDAKEEVGI